MSEIAAVRLDPARAQVYAEGWQSWSQAGPLPVTTAPPAGHLARIARVHAGNATLASAV
jgi:hypothetical protein